MVAACVAAGCGSKPPKVPERDPAEVERLAAAMVKAVPVPGAVRECARPELTEPSATLTRRTLLQLAKQPLGSGIRDAQNAEWLNATELDSPAARTLVDGGDEGTRRRAAAELLSAPRFLVYWIDLVDTPIPLGVKDFKRGYVGARAVRFTRDGRPECVYPFYWRNDPVKQEWAVERGTKKGRIEPEVQTAMQQDLRAQFLKRITVLDQPPPADDGPADDRHDRL